MCLDRVRPPRRYEEVYMGDRARTYFVGCQVKSYTDRQIHEHRQSTLHKTYINRDVYNSIVPDKQLTIHI